jgi:transcriptional regulator with XRE-family HTH domain
MAYTKKKKLNLKIGENIRSVRKSKGWSQQLLGDKVGLSRVCINNIEFGRNGDMPVSHIFLFSDILGSTPYHILGI